MMSSYLTDYGLIVVLQAVVFFFTFDFYLIETASTTAFELLLKILRACWEFGFGDKKDVFFELIRSNLTIIAVALLVKFNRSKHRL